MKRLAQFFVGACLILGYLVAANATPWQNGQVITYTQNEWSSTTGQASVVQAHYDSIYAATNGLFVVGTASGFSMIFDSSTALLSYIPAIGTVGPLNSNLLDPTTSSSGAFGGEVVGLKLNIDFSDAGVTLGTSGIPFGNLILTNFSGTLSNLDGLTVRQFLGDLNTLLGGGSSIDSIPDLYPISQNLNGSFDGGVVSTFAQDHLEAPTSSVPESGSTLLFFGLGAAALGLGWSRRHSLT